MRRRWWLRRIILRERTEGHTIVRDLEGPRVQETVTESAAEEIDADDDCHLSEERGRGWRGD